MKKILKHLFEHKMLDYEQAKNVMRDLGAGKFNETEIASFITVYLMRSISIPELAGFRDGLLELALPLPIDGSELIDIVGSGGDGKNTFNISTLACFIAAGAGKKIAKHGNYGATSVSGSSNVMEELGYRFKTDSDQLQREIGQAGICFLHAPLFHPALKAVGQIRRNLGFRTFFNMLGPMVNPVAPGYQLVGVYNLELARIYNYLLQETGRAFTIVHSLDGYDEISLTGDSKIITAKGEKIYDAVQLGKRMVSPEDIQGGSTVKDAARIFMRILNREGTWAQNAVVLANAAMALENTGGFPDYESAYEAAVDSLESGRALKSFEQLISMQ
jgi:anthranilate phosphoribosyltransferase